MVWAADRMKDVADKMPDQERFEEAADSLSERADRHLATADAIEQHDRSD
jgi:hypothetical protein